MSVKIREKRGKLYLDIYQNSRRSWEALHLTLTEDKDTNKALWRMAEICRAKREMQILSGAWNIQDTTAGRESIADYAVKVAAMPKRCTNIKTCAEKLKQYKGGSTYLSAINSEWVRNFQKYLEYESGLALSSASAYSTALRTILNQAVKDNVILRSPAKNVPRITAPEKMIEFLSIEELKALYSAANNPIWQECARAFFFGYYTGLRISDLRSLTWGMINMNPLQLVKIQKKTSMPVYIPLAPQAWSLINDGLEHLPNVCIFSLPCYSTTLKCLDKWVAAAGIKRRVRWHLARKTFATQSLEAGAEIYTVAKLLGHHGLEQVTRYAEATNKLKRAAVERLPTFNK
ncbi:MAG: site-specific integrase [Termitinemataceae bacterium]|nr:MAG: site-specific integrase [Termitinemataceae bacterium]